MPFSCAFVEEVYRCRPTVPIGIPHKASKTTKFRKWIIPKGTKVNFRTECTAKAVRIKEVD